MKKAFDRTKENWLQRQIGNKDRKIGNKGRKIRGKLTKIQSKDI